MENGLHTRPVEASRLPPSGACTLQMQGLLKIADSHCNDAPVRDNLPPGPLHRHQDDRPYPPWQVPVGQEVFRMDPPANNLQCVDDGHHASHSTHAIRARKRGPDDDLNRLQHGPRAWIGQADAAVP